MNTLKKYLRSRINAVHKHTGTAAFGKFTGGARDVLRLAQEEARSLNHHYMGTEHILLGIVREEKGVAGRALKSLGVELDKVRSAVVSMIGRGERPVMGEMGLTPRAKRVIQLAVDEARRLGHNYIGTEHLLLGLLREKESVGAKILANLGLNADRIRSVVETELHRI